MSSFAVKEHKGDPHWLVSSVLCSLEVMGDLFSTHYRQVISQINITESALSAWYWKKHSFYLFLWITRN